MSRLLVLLFEVLLIYGIVSDEIANSDPLMDLFSRIQNSAPNLNNTVQENINKYREMVGPLLHQLQSVAKDLENKYFNFNSTYVKQLKENIEPFLQKINENI